MQCLTLLKPPVVLELQIRMKIPSLLLRFSLKLSQTQLESEKIITGTCINEEEQVIMEDYIGS